MHVHRAHSGGSPARSRATRRGLLTHVVLLGDALAAGFGLRQARGGRAQAGRDRVDTARIDQNARLGRDELGGPPMRVATTGRSEASASRTTWPNGSIRLGWQTTSLAAIQVRDRRARRGRASRTRSRPSSCARSGPSPTKTRLPSSSVGECVGEPNDVLALVERARRRGRTAPRPPSPSSARSGAASRWRKRGRGRRRSRSRRPCPRASGSSPRAPGAGSRKRRSRRRRGGRRPRSRSPTPGIAPTLRTSRPWAVRTSRRPTRLRGERSRCAGREEEMRVDDVGVKAARLRERARREPAVFRRRAAATVDDDTGRPRCRPARARRRAA